jgi:hypothetical protein
LELLFRRAKFALELLQLTLEIADLTLDRLDSLDRSVLRFGDGGHPLQRKTVPARRNSDDAQPTDWPFSRSPSARNAGLVRISDRKVAHRFRNV